MSPSASPTTTRFAVADECNTTPVVPKLFTARVTVEEVVKLFLGNNSGRITDTTAATTRVDNNLSQTVSYNNETLTPITLLLGWVVDEHHEGIPLSVQKILPENRRPASPPLNPRPGSPPLNPRPGSPPLNPRPGSPPLNPGNLPGNCSCVSLDALDSHTCALWLEISVEAPRAWSASFPSPDKWGKGLLFYPEWIKWQNCTTLIFRQPGRLKEIGSLATSVPSSFPGSSSSDSFRIYLWEGSETLLMTQSAAQQWATKLQRALSQAYAVAEEKRFFLNEALFSKQCQAILPLEPIRLFSNLECRDVDLYEPPMSRACAHPTHSRAGSYIHSSCRPALCDFVSLSRRLANENWLFYGLLCDWYHGEHCSGITATTNESMAWSWSSSGALDDNREFLFPAAERRASMSQSSPTKVLIGNRSRIPVLAGEESDRGHHHHHHATAALRPQSIAAHLYGGVQDRWEDETSAASWAVAASEGPMTNQRIRLSCESSSCPPEKVTRSSTVGKNSVPPLSFAMIRNMNNVEENGRCGQSTRRRYTSPLSSTRKNPDIMKSPHQFPSSRSNVSSEISSSHSTDRSSTGDNNNAVGCSSSSVSRGISLPNVNPLLLATRGGAITTLKLPLANLKRSPNNNSRDRDLSSERNQPSSARHLYTHTADAQDRPALLAKYKSVCSVVIPNRLFLGGETVAQDFQKLVANGVTHILNTAGDTCPNYFQDKFSYLTYVLLDSRFTNEILEAVILHSVSFIEDAINQGGAVFVHCKEGVSRSCTHVVAYLMWKFRLSFQSALDRVRDVREVCNPNTGFTFTLLRLGKRLHRYSIETPIRSDLRKASSAVSATMPPPNPEQKLSRLTLHHPAAPFLVLQGSAPLNLFPTSSSEPTPLILDKRFYYVCRDDLLFFIWKGSQVPRRIEELAQETINSYLNDIRFFEGIPQDHPDWEVIRLDERDEEYYCEPQEFWRLMAEIMMPTNSSLGLLCLNVNPVNRVNLVGTQKALDREATCLAEEGCVSQLFNFEAWQEQLRRVVGTPKSDRIQSGELRMCQRQRSFTFIPPKNTELVNAPC